ncbi:hypothetical protein [Thermomonospora sp. CIF 1]|uniref:hypothetical protein n=1 Tax=Thermomonospora sp. CIF 1 TaxID=1916083 RepID=UPI000CC327F1|nr:hypothetical protein [Thermomonospora sp. CIF 1]PKK12948.1 MAG: hypothetical protein BUE48_015635 [Thermomonospora sp. CIF 1]
MPLDKDSLAKIRRLQQRFADEITRIRQNPDLSDLGKRKAMAVARHRTVQEIDRIRDEATATWQTRKAALERRLFSIGSEPDHLTAALSLRDAMDRVSGVKTAHEAQLLMRRAIRTGDQELARATFMRAWDEAGSGLAGSGWGQVVRDYVTHVRSDLAGDVEELAEMQAATTPAARMAERIETGVPTPPELAGLSSYDLAKFAAEAETGASA